MPLFRKKHSQTDRGPRSQDQQYRRLIRQSLAASDWHGAYSWAKGWIGQGGGARLLDPWLAYVASALLHGQPRTAVHSVDLALKHWIEHDADRATLHWVRSRVIRFALNDPKTAAIDLDSARGSIPLWLRADVESDVSACAVEAAASRKRKPSVKQAPPYIGPGETKVPPSSCPPPGTRPQLWPDVLPHLQRR